MSLCPACNTDPCEHSGRSTTMPLDIKGVNDVGRLIANDVYRVVYEKIYMHESRGFNAHARAQEICEQAKFEAVKWLKLQYGIKDEQFWDKV